MCLCHEGPTIGFQCHWWFVEGTLEQVTFQFFGVDGSMVKLMLKSNFSLLPSFLVEFERVVNRLGDVRGQSKHGLWGSSVKTRKNLSGAWQKRIMCTYFGWETPSCIPILVYLSAGFTNL